MSPCLHHELKSNLYVDPSILNHVRDTSLFHASTKSAMEKKKRFTIWELLIEKFVPCLYGVDNLI